MIHINNSFIEANDRFDEGYDAGREAGVAEGSLDASEEQVNEALQAGYQAGLNAPDNEHFAAGYKAGVADTRRLPEETYQDGWDAGHAVGYDDGMRLASCDE